MDVVNKLTGVNTGRAVEGEDGARAWTAPESERRAGRRRNREVRFVSVGRLPDAGNTPG